MRKHSVLLAQVLLKFLINSCLILFTSMYLKRNDLGLNFVLTLNEPSVHCLVATRNVFCKVSPEQQEQEQEQQLTNF